MKATLLVSLTLLVLCIACSSDSEPQRLPPGSAAATATPKPEEPKAMPMPALAPAPAPATGLVFTAQPGWIVEKPSSGMRKAQYRLPKVDADTEDATLVVFYFGVDQGGNKEDNLARWARQFKQPDDRPSLEAMKRSTRSVNGMPVLDVDLSGTYLGDGMPGAPPSSPKSGWHLLESIVDSDHGSYFVRLIGPDATVAKWEASYRGFISELKPGK